MLAGCRDKKRFWMNGKKAVGGDFVAIHLPISFEADQPSSIKRIKIGFLAATYTFSM